MYNIFFIHSSAYGHLCYFHVVAIVNSAAVNIGVHVSFQTMFSPGVCPGVQLLNQRWVLNIQMNEWLNEGIDATVILWTEKGSIILSSPAFQQVAISLKVKALLLLPRIMIIWYKHLTHFYIDLHAETRLHILLCFIKPWVFVCPLKVLSAYLKNL